MASVRPQYGHYDYIAFTFSFTRAQSRYALRARLRDWTLVRVDIIITAPTSTRSLYYGPCTAILAFCGRIVGVYRGYCLSPNLQNKF